MSLYFDEFIYSLKAEYTANFAPSTVPETYVPGGEISYPGPFSYPQAYVGYTPSENTDISSGDFTIEGSWRVDYQYYTPSGDELPRYTIVSQSDGNLEDITNTATVRQNYWALEFYNDQLIFSVWDYSTQSFIINAVAPVSINWDSSFTNNRKTNNSGYINFAVVRSGNLLRIYVDGVQVIEVSASDWETSTSDIQILGSSGWVGGNIPYSTTSISNLSITDSALYWANYTPAPITYYGGICLVPRIYPRLVKGLPGDTYGVVPVMIRLGADVHITNMLMNNSDSVTLTDWSNPHFPNYGNATLPSVEGDGYVGVSATGNASLPGIKSSGRTGEHILGNFPSFTATGLALKGLSANGNATFPSFVGNGFVVELNISFGKSSFPSFDGTGVAFDNPVGNIVASFPKWIGDGNSKSYSVTVIGNTDVIGICLNTEINAISQYADFSFDSMCVFNGEIIGAGSSGIYTHDGDNDGTNSILAFFELFATNLGTTKQKRIKRIFIDGTFMGFLQSTSIFDTADGTTYTSICSPTLVSSQLKVPMNYTDNGEYISLRICNIDGSDFSVDNIDADISLLALPAKQYTNIGRIKATFPSITGA